MCGEGFMSIRSKYWSPLFAGLMMAACAGSAHAQEATRIVTTGLAHSFVDAVNGKLADKAITNVEEMNSTPAFDAGEPSTTCDTSAPCVVSGRPMLCAISGASVWMLTPSTPRRTSPYLISWSITVFIMFDGIAKPMPMLPPVRERMVSSPMSFASCVSISGVTMKPQPLMTCEADSTVLPITAASSISQSKAFVPMGMWTVAPGPTRTRMRATAMPGEDPETLPTANAGWGEHVKDRPLYVQEGNLVTERSVSHIIALDHWIVGLGNVRNLFGYNSAVCDPLFTTAIE